MKTKIILAVAVLSLADLWREDIPLQTEPQRSAAVYPWGDAWAWTRCPGGGVWCPPFDREHGPKPDAEATVKLWRVVPLHDEKGRNE